MQNYLTEIVGEWTGKKMMLNTRHGLDCCVEVCKPGYPDDDEVIFRGAAGDCLRYIAEYVLPMDGDSYFSFTTNEDNYCGYNFEEIAYRMGFDPTKLEEIVGWQSSIDMVIADATDRTAAGKEAAGKDMER